MNTIYLILVASRLSPQGIIVLILFATPFVIALVYSFVGTVKEGFGLFREIAIKGGVVHYSSKTTENVTHYLGMFPYYQKLSSSGKEEFIRRTLNFLNTKTIIGEDHYQPDYAAKIHVSAAATQLTFGLPDFSFSHFHDQPGRFFGGAASGRWRRLGLFRNLAAARRRTNHDGNP